MSSLPIKNLLGLRSKVAPVPISGAGAELYRLIYFSRSRLLFNMYCPLETLGDIIRSSLRRNEDLCLTGLLVYSGRNFAQVLEGRKRDVEAVFAAIAADSRHQDVSVVERWPVRNRAFSEWSVRFMDIADGSEVELTGTSQAEVSLQSQKPALSLLALLRYCVEGDI